MGSQLPQNLQQAASALTMPGLPQAATGIPEIPASASTLPTASPQLQAQIAQALNNPNAGDAFQGPAKAAAGTVQENPLLPGSPQDMLLGAGVGTAFGLGMTAINEKLGKNGLTGFERLGARIDRLPGIRNVSSGLEARLANVKQPWAREWLLRDAIDTGSPRAVANMQRQQLDRVAAGLPKHPEVQTILKGSKNFTQAQEVLSNKISALEAQGKLNKADYKLLKAYRGAFHSIKGIDSISYKPLFMQQADQASRMAGKGVGPIGRGVANLSTYTQRIFGGDTMKSMMGGKLMDMGGGTYKSRLLPSALGGAFIFGSAISKAKKAEDGEKLSTFMHDFLGIGIGSFIGWEVGQKLLTAIGFRGMMDKVGNKIGLGNISNRLMTPGRGLLEKFLSPATVTKVVRFLPKITFGGFAVGAIGMFVFGSIFQKIFEKVSDSIFGKPSDKSLGKEPTPPANSGMPGMSNPAMPAAPVQATGGSLPTFQQATAATPAVTRGSQATTPSFSLTPDDIRRSTAADQSIMNAQLLQQQLGL